MPIRELIARLGFEADLTEATRFNKTLKDTKINIDGLNKLSLGGLDKRLGGFFAAGSIFAGGLKAFFKFSDVQQAINELEFKGVFDILSDDIDAILKDDLIGNLVQELDLLNAAASEVGRGLDPKVIEDLLRPATLFAINTRKSVSEILSGISSFISDANLDILIQTGKLNQAQVELLKAAGTGPGKEGIIARTERIRSVFLSISGDLEKQTKKLVDTGALSAKELAGAFDKLTIAVGEEGTTGLFQELNKTLIPFIEILTKFVRGEITPTEIAEKARVEPQIISQALIEFPKLGELILKTKTFFDVIGRAGEEDRKKLKEILQIAPGNRAAPVIPTPGVTLPIPGQTTTGGGITINNNVMVSSGAQVDETKLVETLEKVNRRSWGDISDQAKRTTIRRGGP